MDLDQLQQGWSSFAEVTRKTRIRALQFLGDSRPVKVLNTFPADGIDSEIDPMIDWIVVIAIPPHDFDRINRDQNRAIVSAVAALLEAYLGHPWGSIQIGFVSGLETFPGEGA